MVKDQHKVDDTTLSAETTYPINFTQLIFVSTLRQQQFILFINASKIYQFKSKESEIKYYTLCLGNISKDFTINNMNKARLKRNKRFLSIDFNPIDANDTLDIHNYLIKKINQCLGKLRKHLLDY